MKKKPYNIPTINTITLNQPLLETISGGNQGWGETGGGGRPNQSKSYDFDFDDDIYITDELINLNNNR